MAARPAASAGILDKPPTVDRRATVLGTALGNRWHHELCIDAVAVVRLYLSGLSTRQVAAQMGYSFSYVHRLCQDVGVTRDRTVALRLRHRPTSKQWRSSRAVARPAVERFPRRRGHTNEHVPPKDGAYTNKGPGNLEGLNPRPPPPKHHPPQ